MCLELLVTIFDPNDETGYRYDDPALDGVKNDMMSHDNDIDHRDATHAVILERKNRNGGVVGILLYNNTRKHILGWGTYLDEQELNIDVEHVLLSTALRELNADQSDVTISILTHYDSTPLNTICHLHGFERSDCQDEWLRPACAIQNLIDNSKVSCARSLQ